MRRLALILALALFLPAAAIAEHPGRPLPLTPEQFRALRQLEAAPEHRAVRDVRATYGSEHEARMEAVRACDDFSTAAYYATYPGLIIGLLICTAPL